jgi:hypothetical protein
MEALEKREIHNAADYRAMDYEGIVVQKIIHRNITRAYYLMMGNGGYYKSSVRELENVRFTIDYREFREEANLESSLIYCEAVASYDPDHFITTGKGEKQIKFTSWLYWKLRDLDGRMWRLFASGCKSLDAYVDAGKGNSFESEFIFRDSLSSEASEVLAMIETGKGFKLKKSRVYDKAVCHIGVQNFWESFIRDSEDCRLTYREFLSSWNEIRKGWNEIETDSMIYTVIDSVAV